MTSPSGSRNLPGRKAPAGLGVGCAVVVLLVAAWLSNPGPAAHLSTLKAYTVPDTPLGRMISLPRMSPDDVEYQNHVLFSTTRRRADGRRLTVGLFGMVFDRSGG